jgi:hypothetical protein
MKIHRNPWKSINIYENQWKSMKIYENLSKSMDTYEDPKKFMKICESLWDILRRGVISYILGEEASYMSSKEELIVSTEKMKIKVFCKICSSVWNTHIKVTVSVKTWNDPTFITHMLPQTVSHKNTIQAKCLAKLLLCNFRATKWIWKIGENKMAMKSRPPDCGITSVSLRKSVCWKIQPTQLGNVYWNWWT